eukprot:scaffold285827_cov37-Prasinocladus_malaysianus.AAC.2
MDPTGVDGAGSGGVAALKTLLSNYFSVGQFQPGRACAIELERQDPGAALQLLASLCKEGVPSHWLPSPSPARLPAGGSKQPAQSAAPASPALATATPAGNAPVVGAAGRAGADGAPEGAGRPAGLLRSQPFRPGARQAASLLLLGPTMRPPGGPDPDPSSQGQRAYGRPRGGGPAGIQPAAAQTERTRPGRGFALRLRRPPEGVCGWTAVSVD